jgi:hypothetical protein
MFLPNLLGIARPPQALLLLDGIAAELLAVQHVGDDQHEGVAARLLQVQSSCSSKVSTSSVSKFLVKFDDNSGCMGFRATLEGRNRIADTSKMYL